MILFWLGIFVSKGNIRVSFHDSQILDRAIPTCQSRPMKTLLGILVLFVVSCAAPTVMNRDQVRGTIRKSLPQIKDCYVSALKEKPDLKGKIQIRFEVDDEGKVPTCETKSSDLNTPSVDKCICNRITGIKFPPAPKGQKADIIYPFVFSYSD